MRSIDGLFAIHGNSTGNETGTMEFSLNGFTEFAEFSDKNIFHYSKKARTCHPAISCVRDQDATRAPTRHM